MYAKVQRKVMIYKDCSFYYKNKCAMCMKFYIHKHVPNMQKVQHKVKQYASYTISIIICRTTTYVRSYFLWATSDGVMSDIFAQPKIYI